MIPNTYAMSYLTLYYLLGHSWELHLPHPLFCFQILKKGNFVAYQCLIYLELFFPWIKIFKRARAQKMDQNLEKSTSGLKSRKSSPLYLMKSDKVKIREILASRVSCSKRTTLIRKILRQNKACKSTSSNSHPILSQVSLLWTSVVQAAKSVPDHRQLPLPKAPTFD